MDSIVGAIRSEKTGRPHRKVAKRVKNLFLNESDDDVPEPFYDSDHENDHEFTEKDAELEAVSSSGDDNDENDDIVGHAKPAKVSQQRGGKGLPYNPPSSLAPILNEYRDRRLEAMKDAFANDSYEAEISWKPNDDDVLEIERTVLSRYVNL